MPTPAAITYSELAVEIGDYLAKGRDSTLWNATDAARIDGFIQSGVQQFYYPPVGQSGRSHDWAFLKPVAILTTVADQARYDLPEDFGSLVGDLTWPIDDSGYFSIPAVGEGQIRAVQQGANLAAGKPIYCAVRPKTSDGSGVQQFELLFERAFDAAYELTYCYRIVPPKISAEKPYVYGGPAHRETVIESCLAIAEQRMNDGGSGMHKGLFLERLGASIAIDRRSEAATLGYFGDGTACQWPNDRMLRVLRVTYNNQWSEQ